MLACIAEGKSHADEDENAHCRGATLSCALSHEDTCSLMSVQKRTNTAMGSCATDTMETSGRVAEATSADAETSHARPAQNSLPARMSTTTPTQRRMAATTALALRLAEASSAQQTSGLPASSTLQDHYRTKLPGDTAADNAEGENTAENAEGPMLDDSIISVHNWDWEDAYNNWHRQIFSIGHEQRDHPQLEARRSTCNGPRQMCCRTNNDRRISASATPRPRSARLWQVSVVEMDSLVLRGGMAVDSRP